MEKLSIIDTCDALHIKSVVIHEEDYPSSFYSNVYPSTIPPTICRFVEVETISISAYITELPVEMSLLFLTSPSP